MTNPTPPNPLPTLVQLEADEISNLGENPTPEQIQQALNVALIRFTDQHGASPPLRLG